MHFDHSVKLSILLLSLVASSRQYTIEERNSVILVLNLPVAEYQDNTDGVRDAVYTLIANFTTANCTFMKQDCKLNAKYPRSSGTYKREIAVEDYTFTEELVTELKLAAMYNYSNQTSDPEKTEMVFYLPTYTSYDYLKWTEIVRIIYFYRMSFNSMFKDLTGRTEDILTTDPSSYVAAEIEDNSLIPTLISVVMLGAALLMFLIVVPLSRTRFCRKELQDKEETEIEELRKDGKV